MSAATDRNTQTHCATCGARFLDPQHGRTGRRCEECANHDDEAQ